MVVEYAASKLCSLQMLPSSLGRRPKSVAASLYQGLSSLLDGGDLGESLTVPRNASMSLLTWDGELPI